MALDFRDEVCYTGENDAETGRFYLPRQYLPQSNGRACDEGSGDKGAIDLKIRKIALIGAGAIGAYLIWSFEGAAGVTFTAVAEGTRRERLERDGIVINGAHYPLRVREPGHAGPQDLIFIATKYGALDEAIAMLPPLIGPDTLVLSLLNGVDSEDRVARAVGREHVVHSVIRIASRRTEAGVQFDPDRVIGLSFGLPGAGAEEKGKMDALSALFAGTRLRWRPSDDILTDIWLKFASNIANNLPQAVIGAPAGLYQKSEHGLFLAQKLWSEAAAVAAARGVRLPEDVLIFPGQSPAAKYSTLQDLEAGRHTEIDMFAGHMVRMAEETGISVPYCEYTLHAIKALEEKNDGLFD